MHEWLMPYAPTVLALGATAALLVIQLLVVDVAGIRGGHKPGMPVETNHADFLFRATRAQANTNESIAAFVLLTLFGIFSTAAAGYLNAFAWIYVAGRAGHMCCYYAGLQLARSACFGIGLLGLLGMTVVGFAAWV